VSAAIGRIAGKPPSRAPGRRAAPLLSVAATLDAFLASDAPLHATAEQLFQGPVADALIHCGQLAMLRRLSGSPARGENFFVADIKAGQVRSRSARAVRPFKPASG